MKKSARLYRPHNHFSVAGGLVAFGLVATALYVLIATYAAGASYGSEPELATLSDPSMSISDPAASGGKAIQFKAAATGPDPTAPSTILLGAAVEPNQLDDPAFTAALTQYKFDSLTAENAMKFGQIEPNRGQFNWEGADKIVNYAVANNMRVRGHTLVWHRDVPGWVNDLSSAEAATVLENHIKQVVTRYKGKIAQWDVVNEALDEDGSLRDTVWLQKLGEGYIAQAFRWANEADPTAELYYNEYGTESTDLDGDGSYSRAAKANAQYELMRNLLNEGVPIKGVGLQTHSAGYYPGRGADILTEMKRLGDLGLEIEITELDVINLGDAEKVERYAELGRTCKDSGVCTGVTTWGLYDGHTWRGTEAAPLLLDTNFNAKPSYDALMTALGRP